MSSTYNPEADTIAEIERIEMEARALRRRIEHVHTAEDRRALSKQLTEIKDRADFLRRSLR
jgi:hypothetical protein